MSTMSKVPFSVFSKKQLTALSWWHPASPYSSYDAIICDGAVRSGKTTCMSLSFIVWSFYEFDDTSFALCGKTVTSLKRNIVVPLLSTLRELGFDCKEKLSQNLITVSYGKRSNRYYLFGGKDEGSAALIQGMTLGGVLLDEVALMPRSFTEQALARCSLKGSRLWFNCNPESPAHWFYEQWIKKAEEKNCLYLHFLMQDNPSLSRDILRRYESLYSGTFYERFVLGRWVTASGLVYGDVADGKYVESPPVKAFDKYYISCDYGTVNPTSMGLWGLWGGVWYRFDEFYRTLGRLHFRKLYIERKLLGIHGSSRSIQMDSNGRNPRTMVQLVRSRCRLCSSTDYHIIPLLAKVLRRRYYRRSS